MGTEPLRLLTRRGCHLCELVEEPLQRLALDGGLTVQHYDIDEDASLRNRYDQRVPVLLWGDEVLAEGRFDPESALQTVISARDRFTIQ
ncbi:MAG: glutaredoxin family protein [Candidatus Dormibacteria bacterium]